MTTYGEWRVGVSFNPSNNPRVDEIKKKTAELIDLMHGMYTGRDVQEGQPYYHAAELYEDAAMWAVKGFTRIPYKKDM